MAKLSAPLQLDLQRKTAARLVEQVTDGLAGLIESGELRSGERLPSVRQFAQSHDIGASTVVEAYEQLVARGMLQARRGAGFFVAARAGQSGARAVFVPPEPVIDSAWLLSEMFADERVPIKAGCGWLPGKWLNDEGLHQAERRIIRSPVRSRSAMAIPMAMPRCASSSRSSWATGRWSWASSRC
jgi:DNA-binding transcriptional MocR family regulator